MVRKTQSFIQMPPCFWRRAGWLEALIMLWNERAHSLGAGTCRGLWTPTKRRGTRARQWRSGEPTLRPRKNISPSWTRPDTRASSPTWSAARHRPTWQSWWDAGDSSYLLYFPDLKRRLIFAPSSFVHIRWFQRGRGSSRPALRREGRRGSTPCWLKRRESSISSSSSTRWMTQLSTGA